MRTTRIVGIGLIAIGVILTVVGLLTPSEGHFGMNNPSTGYSSTSIMLIAIGAVLIVVGVILMFIKQERPQVVVAANPAPAAQPAARPEPSENGEMAAEGGEAASAPVDEAGRNELVLRLLTGDERVIFKVIADSGGMALQKDLIAKTKMSDAKVSRTIDKLVDKGLVKKERYGVTNRITITADEKPPQ